MEALKAIGRYAHTKDVSITVTIFVDNATRAAVTHNPYWESSFTLLFEVEGENRINSVPYHVPSRINSADVPSQGEEKISKGNLVKVQQDLTLDWMRSDNARLFYRLEETMVRKPKHIQETTSGLQMCWRILHHLELASHQQSIAFIDIHTVRRVKQCD